jgi:hypothetical protein
MTANTVQGINAGDRVCYVNGSSGWGYPGSGQPVCPTVASVNTGTNTLTLNSPGIPASLSAGQVVQVISRQLYPYLQSFVYGNVFDLDQPLYATQPGPPIHYGWDTSAGIDSVSDRAGTLYFYDNTLVYQWDLSGSTGSSYGVDIFQTESDSDTIEADNNLFYTTNANSGNQAAFIYYLSKGSYTETSLVSVTYTGGNNQVGTASSQGSNTSCSTTLTGWVLCTSTLDSSGSVTATNLSSEAPTSLYPSGVSGGVPFALQTGSSGIGAASSLPAAIASNTLGLDFTPTLNFDGTTRTNLNDLGATQYTQPPTGTQLSGVASGVIQ